MNLMRYTPSLSTVAKCSPGFIVRSPNSIALVLVVARSFDWRADKETEASRSVIAPPVRMYCHAPCLELGHNISFIYFQPGVDCHAQVAPCSHPARFGLESNCEGGDFNKFIFPTAAAVSC